MYCLFYQLASGLLLIGFISACQPTTDVLAPAPTDRATPVGQPVGHPSSQLIGPQGGTLQSADGQLQLIVPAGALAQATTISIQPITNQAPNGLGTAYRFTPEGTVFAKPATLTWHYEAANVAVNDADLLGVSYQTIDQHWQAIEPLLVDTVRRQITLAMPHFSDWSAYELAKLEAISLVGKDYLELRTSTTLQVDAFMVEPLVNPRKQQLELDYSHIKWSVLGGPANGSLQASQETAVYTAPGQLPTPKPVTVMAELHFKNSSKTVYLLKRIQIGGDYFTTNFGGDVYTWPQTLCYRKDGTIIISGYSGDNQSLNIIINLANSTAGISSYAYADDSRPGSAVATFTASYNNGLHSYRSYMPQCAPNSPNIISGGGVHITGWETANGVTHIQGTLSGTLMNLPGPCPVQLLKKSVEATFRLRLIE